jgi:hypothetical protein
VEEAKFRYDEGYGPDHCPPYMVIYSTVRRTCEEQRKIVDEAVDCTVLSSVFKRLPRLTEVGIHFRMTVKGQKWLESYSCFSRMTMRTKSWEHHTRVVSHALWIAKYSGVSIQAINLLAFNLWASDKRQESALSEPLQELLGSVRILRLTASHSALNVLSLCALNLHHFDMCRMIVPHAALKDFLACNRKSIWSIGFHDVSVFDLSSDCTEPFSDVLCRMLEMPQSMLCRAAGRCCPYSPKQRWRLLLKDDRLRCSAGTWTKRKFNEL